MNLRFPLNKSRALLTGAAFALLIVGGLNGCKQDNTTDPRNLTPMVSIEGSDTMSVLLQDWSKQFMEQNADIPVSVTIVDSGAGIKALLEKSTDIAASSRDLTNEENTGVHDKGIHLVRRIVALDSIAVIVNPASPVEEMSMTDLRKVFSGETSNWSSLNKKASGTISVCTRETDSGTGQYFREHVLSPHADVKGTNPGNFAKTCKILTSNEALIETVEKDKAAIGFIPLSNAVEAKDKIKILKVKLMEKADAVMPSVQATTDDYSLSRPLYMFFDSKSKPSTRKFVDFCLSEKGQEIVKSHGFVSLK